MSEAEKAKQYDDILKDISYYYKILGLDLEADRKRLVKAYKEALKRWSPEQYADDPIFQKKAIMMTKKIDKAYENILIYMTHPQYQYHPFNKSNTPEPIPQGTFIKEKQGEIKALSKRQKFAFPGISLYAIKPLSSIPNAAFFAYVCLVMGITIFKYEAFSVYLIPHILMQNTWFLVPPLIGCIAFNLVNGEGRKMKGVSILLTGIYLFVVFPFETDLYQKLLHKEEVVLQTDTTVNPDTEWINKGDELKSSGKYQASVRAYSKALEVNPGSPDAYYGRATVYALMDKDHEFISDLRDAARLGHMDAIKTLNRLDIRY
jgi:tetratricopeptide (TPR) repeat protein